MLRLSIFVLKGRRCELRWKPSGMKKKGRATVYDIISIIFVAQPTYIDDVLACRECIRSLKKYNFYDRK